MLETIREFARDRLTEQEMGGPSLRRHAEYFFEQAQVHGEERSDDFVLEQFEWFGREHDNLRTALDYWHEQEVTEPELRLVTACSGFWERGGYWTEGRQRSEAALARAGEAPPDVRAGVERRLSFVACAPGRLRTCKGARGVGDRPIRGEWNRSGRPPPRLRRTWQSASRSLETLRDHARSTRRSGRRRTSVRSP